MMMAEAGEFQEIGHCGGQYVVSVRTTSDGQKETSIGLQHSRPTAAAFFALYALPQGVPIAMATLTGMGGASDQPPTPDANLILIGSDVSEMFGHECGSCGGYWRSTAAPSGWRMTCPYCGVRFPTHHFLTAGQRRYLHACCNLIREAISSGKDGDHIIDMDEVADSVGKKIEKPAFYYAEEIQQNNFKCAVCGVHTDILGRFGYCCSCGTHNGSKEIETETAQILAKVSSGETYEACVKDAVSAFDSYARQIAKQLSERVPMTPRRKREWEKKLFHNLRACADDFRNVFDIDIFKDMKTDDISFAVKMFHRRHVYEHNGGEVDEKYIKDSGDDSVRIKQVIHESAESASRTVRLIRTMAANIHHSFHLIFPIEDKAVR